jgi:hypothetical protein
MNQNEIRLIELKLDCLPTLLQELAKGNRESSKIAQDGSFHRFHKFKLSEQRQALNSLSDKLGAVCVRPSFSAGVLLEQLCCVREAESGTASGL